MPQWWNVVDTWVLKTQEVNLVLVPVRVRFAVPEKRALLYCPFLHFYKNCDIIIIENESEEA